MANKLGAIVQAVAKTCNAHITYPICHDDGFKYTDAG